MQKLYFISLFFHIVSATIWLGGMLFLGFVLVPVMRRAEFRHLSSKLLELSGNRFRVWSWGCLTTFVLTGIFNLSFRFGSPAALFDASMWRSGFGHILQIKLTLFAMILLLSAVHDFLLGPKATRLLQAEPNSAAAEKLRKQASWFGRINVLLGLVIVSLGTMLVRGTP